MPTGKQPQETPVCSGIYQIRCTRNGKIYIGSAVSIATRWGTHRRDLRRGLHANPHLQHAWNLHSEVSFEFTVLERVERARLLEAEQNWIDRTNCANHHIGFNVKLEATCSGEGIGRTRTGFRDPNGNLVTIVGLYGFCRREGLDYRSMHRLATGNSKLKSYKGWTHTNSRRQRDYIKTHEGFIDPNGTPVGPVRNLAAFCRDQGLDTTHMVAVASGRIVSHRGWTHVRGRKRLPLKVYEGFIAPHGVVVTITNLAAFCRANRLSKVHMYQVRSGKRRRHKGWTWKQHDAQRTLE